MIRRKIFIGLLVIVFSQWLYGQKVSNIDFDEIKKAIQDNQSDYYYPLLIERFINFDTSFTETEYQHIYYVSVYSDNYSPYRTSDNEKQFIEKFNQKKFEEAIPYGKEVLTENPVNLRFLFRMFICYQELNDMPIAYQYASMYYPLLNVILHSGDGRSKQTAFVVVSVSDEYAILNELELTWTTQSLSGRTDIFTVKRKGEVEPVTIEKKGRKSKKRQTNSESIYFDVSKPMETLQQLFRKNE